MFIKISLLIVSSLPRTLKYFRTSWHCKKSLFLHKHFKLRVCHFSDAHQFLLFCPYAMIFALNLLCRDFSNLTRIGASCLKYAV